MPELTYRRAGQDDAGAIAAIGSQMPDELGERSGLPGALTPAAPPERTLPSAAQRGEFLLPTSPAPRRSWRPRSGPPTPYGSPPPVPGSWRNGPAPSVR